MSVWKSENFFFNKTIKEYFKQHQELQMSPALWYRDQKSLDFFDM